MGAPGRAEPSCLWAALMAMIERRVPGATTAWAAVNTDLVNLSAWSDGFAADLRRSATLRRN